MSQNEGAGGRRDPQAQILLCEALAPRLTSISTKSGLVQTGRPVSLAAGTLRFELPGI